MVTRIRNAFAVVLLLSFLFVIPAFAGGWAVITLDELPTNVVAGQPFTVGFTVLQHGRTPMDGIYPMITANLLKERMSFNAEAEGKTGHYVATMTLPKGGEWQWSIQAFTMDQPMPALTVAPAGGAMTKSNFAKTDTSPFSPMQLLSGIAFAMALVGVVIAFRNRNRLVTALTAISLVAGVILFIAGAGGVSGVEAQAKSGSTTISDMSISPVEYGRQLFIAKGCITCHYNSKAGSSSDYLTIETGAPNLSAFSANPEVIAMRLKDPSSVKSDTNMPNLDLTKVEIDALVAFINSK